MTKKHIDYYDVIAEQEEKSAKLKKQGDRETSPTERKTNMIERVKRLMENE